MLDVGCASAIDYSLFKGTGIRYIGLDITQKFLDYARHLNPEVDVRLASAIDLPFKDGEVDVVYMKSLVEHLHPDEWRKAITEAWRVSAKKLILCFVLKPREGEAEYNYREEGYYENFLSRDELIDFLKKLRDARKVREILSVGRHDLYVVEKID